MTALRSNVFRILNLDELSAKYRLFRIRGLHKDHPEYYQNRQLLIKKVSFILRTPATVTERGDDGTYLVLREDSKVPDSPFNLIRTSVYFDHTDEIYELKFGGGNDEDQDIATRFLGFMIQNPLSMNPHLWQPGAGKPFFKKVPKLTTKGISHFQGFNVRVVKLPDGGLGLCVDVANKYVQQNPLPTHLTRPEFRPFKGRHCIYHYGHKWYEIQLREFADLTASDYIIHENSVKLSLLAFIARESQKPIPAELATLPADASVVLYATNRNELRAAPSGLCFPVLDTQNTSQRDQPNKLLSPAERYSITTSVAQKYLNNLRFSSTCLKVSGQPVEIPRKFFVVPDYEFGNGRKLSVRKSPEARQVDLKSLGKARLGMLREPTAGFYVNDPLQRQYLLLPQSVQDSLGLNLLVILPRR